MHAIQQQLPQQWCSQPLHPHHVLFMHRPVGASRACTVHAGVWSVVCLAAVNAMDVGRRAAAREQVERQRADAAAAAVLRQQQAAGQQRLNDVWQPAPLTPHQQQHRQQVQQRPPAAQAARLE